MLGELGDGVVDLRLVRLGAADERVGEDARVVIDGMARPELLVVRARIVVAVEVELVQELERDLSGLAALAMRELGDLGVEVFGGIILEPYVGGIDPRVVRNALAMGYGPGTGARFVSLRGSSLTALLSILTTTSSGTTNCKAPFGPFNFTVCPSIFAVTPDGIGTGLLPTRDM